MNQPEYFQYTRVVVTAGEHHFEYNKYIACKEDGLSEEDILEYLEDNHNVDPETTNSTGLDKGMFWTNNEHSAGIFKAEVNTGTDTDPKPVSLFSADDPRIIALKDIAPEMLYIE